MPFPTLSACQVLLAFLLCTLLVDDSFSQPASGPAPQPVVLAARQPDTSASAEASPASAVASSPSPAHPIDLVRLESVPRGAALEIYAVNQGFAPINLVISLTKSKNTGFAPNVIGPNVSHLVQPLSRKLITMAVPLKKGRAMDFAYVRSYSFGDNLAEVQSAYRYRLPIPDGTSAVLRIFSGLPYKTNFMTTANLVELLAPIGTPVVASRSGVVFLTNDTSHSPSAASTSPLGDYILILHDDGGWAVYGWLRPGSLKVKPGDKVELNQAIAAIGPNPATLDTYLLFGVVRNLGGTVVSGIPFTFTSKAVEEINPALFTGPISPDLAIKYPPAVAREPWNPAEDVLPTPPVISNYGDEDLSPLQRQTLYRQRIVDHANAGRETVGDNSTLVFLGGVAVAMSFLAFGLSLLSNGKSSPTGARGWLWSLIHGSQPTGALSFDPSSAKPLIVGPVISDPASPRKPDDSSAPGRDPSSAETATDSEHVPSEANPDPTAAVQRLHDPGTLELIRHVSHATPLGLLSTQSIPLSALVQSAAPTDVLDFVLIRANDGSVVLVILRERNRHLTYTLAGAGIPNVVLPSDPTADQVKAAIQTALT